MLHVINVSISNAAKSIIERQIQKVTAEHKVVGFAYISKFVNPDGSTVAGFRPGYMGSPMPRPMHDSAWLLIRSGCLSFYLFPHFSWDANEQYRIDHVGGDFALLSIEPVG